MNEGVWVCGAAHEEFVCEVVDELADWDHLEVSMEVVFCDISIEMVSIVACCVLRQVH